MQYQTRYVYAPLLDAICQQIPGGYVPAGVIHAIPAPKGKINVKVLPEGAQVLQVVSPSLGLPAPPSKPQQLDPTIQALVDQVQELRAASTPVEKPSIAIFLHE